MLRHVGRQLGDDDDEFFTPLRDSEAGMTPVLKVIEMQSTPGQPASAPRPPGRDFHKAFLRESVGLPCASMSQRARGLVLLNLVRPLSHPSCK